MTDRIPLDDMTSDQLDHLYAELDELRDALAHCHEREPRLRAEAALDRVRALRADLREITGARYIADALDNILGPALTDPAAPAAPTPVPCPACRRADQAGLAPAELHNDCAKEQH